MSRLHAWTFMLSRGRLGRLKDNQPILVLIHKNKKGARAYTLLHFHHWGDRIILPVRQNHLWHVELVALGKTMVHLGDRLRYVKVREATGEDRAALKGLADSAHTLLVLEPRGKLHA